MIKVKFNKDTRIRIEDWWEKIDIKKWEIKELNDNLAKYYFNYWVCQIIQTTDWSDEKTILAEKEKRILELEKEIKQLKSKKQ